MVAISLYRGNLHKVPSNVVRQWLMPARNISLKDFHTLLRRRRRALRRRAAGKPNSMFKNGKKGAILREIGEIEDGGRELEEVGLVEKRKGGILGGLEGKDGVLEGVGKRGFGGRGVEGGKLGGEGEDGVLEGVGKRGSGGRGVEGEDGVLEGRGLEVGKLGEEAKDWILEGFGRRGVDGKALGGEKEKGGGDGKEDLEKGGGVEKLGGGNKGGDVKGGDEGNAGGVGIDRQVEMKVEGVDDGNPSLEIPEKEEDVRDKEKRRQEIEEKLKILNEKKHSLVQALKQILNVEEELKRRSYIQGVAGQLPVGGGQVEGTNDSGSMSRHITPRMGTEGNVSATLPSRTYSGVANSPSRFALAGHQGVPPHLLSVSVSGTNYIASSPSPAASGGTSAFRGGRGPSPWN